MVYFGVFLKKGLLLEEPLEETQLGGVVSVYAALVLGNSCAYDGNY